MQDNFTCDFTCMRDRCHTLDAQHANILPVSPTGAMSRDIGVILGGLYPTSEVIASKHEMVSQSLFNVGPALQTVGQH